MISIESFRDIRGKRHIMVLDTNILLELYRQPANISLDIIEALKRVKDDVYIPRQVYEEYLRNYQAICGSERKKYQKVSKELSEAVRRLQEDINTKTSEYRKHNYTDISKLQSDLDEKIGDIQRIIKDFENKHKTEIQLNMDFLQNDRVKDFVDLLVKQGCVEGELLFSQKMQILQEGRLRFDNLIPPGYMDYAKGGADKYGDLFVWKSIITVAKEKSANILFICNDIKEDWWEKDKESPIELRKELLSEFKEYNPLLDIHFLTLEKFFSYLAEELKIGQSKSALQLSAKEYIDNQLEQYEKEIEKNIEKFFGAVDIQESLGEWLLNVENEEIYWVIRDVSVDKEDKKIIYYIDLDISVLADFIDDENQRPDGKVAIALDGKLRLLTEEYSAENELESVEIEIVDTLHIKPKIWNILKKDSRKHSCREIISSSKEMLKYQDEIDSFSTNMRAAELTQSISGIAGVTEALSTSARIAELTSPLFKAAGVTEALPVSTRVAELIRPQSEVVGVSGAFSAGAKIAEMTSPLFKAAGVTEALSASTRVAELIRPQSEVVGVSGAFSAGAKIAEMTSPLFKAAGVTEALSASTRVAELIRPQSEIMGVVNKLSANERIAEGVNKSIMSSSISELINNDGKTK